MLNVLHNRCILCNLRLNVISDISFSNPGQIPMQFSVNPAPEHLPWRTSSGRGEAVFSFPCFVSERLAFRLTLFLYSHSLLTRRVTVLQLQPKLKNPLLFSFKIIIYMLLFTGFQFALQGLFRHSLPVIAFLLTMIIIVPNRGKLTETLQKFIDRNFYQSYYRFKLILSDFNQKLNTLLDYDPVIEEMSKFLDRTIGNDCYMFFLYQDDNFKPAPRLSPSSHHNTFQLPETDPCWEFLHLPARFYEVAELKKNCTSLIKKNRLDQEPAYFVPLKGTNRITGYLLFTGDIRQYLQFDELRTLLEHLFRKTGQILENASIHQEIKRKSLESQLLLEVVGKITSTLNLHSVLEAIVDNLSKLVKYDAAAIFLVDRGRKVLQEVVTRGYKKSKLGAITLKLDQGISGQVIRTQKGVNIPDVRKHPNYYAARSETRSQLTVPILSQGHAIGAIVLESDHLEHFTRENQELLTFFSGLAAIAIRNARLYEDSLKKKRLESDLLVASRVQRALLPRRVPTIAGLECDTFNIPSQIVGGDLYDVFKIDENRQGFAIGDVSGKGAPAAILMAVAYAGFRSLLKRIDPVVTVVARLNNFLAEATTSSYYVTFVYGIIDRTEQTLTYCNAGHNPPILMRKDRSVMKLDKGGVVLGFLQNQRYQQISLPFQSGDYLCLYTDGVTEIKNKKGEEFGEERLIELLKESYGVSPREMRKQIVSAVQRFSGKKTFQDDLTLLIFYVR